MDNKKYPYMKSYRPYRSIHDPCPPIEVKYYATPPQCYIDFQPTDLEQFSPEKALKAGTLWPAFYDYYENPYE